MPVKAGCGALQIKVFEMRRSALRSAFASVLLVAAVWPSTAWTAEAELTLADLRGFCSDQSAQTQAVCNFFILGAAQGLSIGGKINPGTGRAELDRGAICLPDDLPAANLRMVVLTTSAADIQRFPEDTCLPSLSLARFCLKLTRVQLPPDDQIWQPLAVWCLKQEQIR